MSTLRLRGVTKHWPQKRVALDNISFEAFPGTLTAIIGPSGSGKTTLLKVIAGITSLDSGEIQRIGQPVMVFQEDSLWPHLTLLENVSLPLHVLQGMSKLEAKRQATDLLQKWGLGNHLESHPAELSGGQRQRGALARALVKKPKILCLDEVTAGLDPQTAAGILESILLLKNSETILLMVTHQLNYARRAADRVLFLEGGCILEQGSVVEVLSQPQNPRIERFVAAFDFTASR